ncbi:hypothetical protein RIR_jg13691.t1 [Rhizophagus irregularis DAOM 181602=DAOM 197198]|nr:hypothetical protein RIR_jg13691.t1 [Rhizophagus irregularis DAOM 181602=DAOM 197198]
MLKTRFKTSFSQDLSWDRKKCIVLTVVYIFHYILVVKVDFFGNLVNFLAKADGGAAPPTNGKDPKEVLANEASGTAYWQMEFLSHFALQTRHQTTLTLHHTQESIRDLPT